MQIWNHYIAGVEGIWCLLGASVFLCVLLTWRLLRSLPLHQIARIHREQAGATYMLPLVLTVPFYVLLITMIIECTLLLATKIGSVGAAYSAARAAAVWLPYESAMPKTAPDYTPIEDREAMVRLAAARSMSPYASGSKSHAFDEPLGEFIDQTIAQQIEAFQTYSGDQNFDVEYLNRKFAYAFNASTISIDYFDPNTDEVTDKPAFNAKLQLTLRYEAPIHTFGIGRLFGEKSQIGNFFVLPITTTVPFENEGVKPSFAGKKISPDKLSKSLGIRYYDRAIGIRNTPLAPNSVGAIASHATPAINSANDGAERRRVGQLLTELQRQFIEATGDEKTRLEALIEDYLVALGKKPSKPYTGDNSWTKPLEATIVRGQRFHIYVLEDRTAGKGVTLVRGWTYVEDKLTGIVYRYRHTGLGKDVYSTSNILGLPGEVTHAELQGEMFVDEFSPATSMGSSLSSEVSGGLGLGYVSQDGPNGSTLRGAQMGVIASASSSLGVTDYSYAGTFSSLGAAGYSPLWSSGRQN